MSAKDLLKRDNWIMLNKTLVHKLGLYAAVFIGELCDKEDYFEKDGDWFYVSREKISDDVGLSSDMQRKAGDILIDAGILSIEKRGLPARNYYKINDELLLSWLMSSDTECQQQAVEIPTTRDTEMLQQAKEISTTYKEHIKRTEEKEQNKKTPEPALSHNTRRNFHRDYESLTDDLQSGKDIDEQKKVKKKMSELEKCMAEIDRRNFSDDVKALLKIHLDWSYNSKDPKRITSTRNYKSKLDFLEQRQTKGDNLVQIIQQSIDRCWHAFYEYSTQSNNHKSAASVDNDMLIDQTLTPDEVQAEIARRIANGMEVY